MSAKPTKASDKMAILDELAAKLPIVTDKDYEIKTTPIPSGSLTLDMAIGIGGYPRGGIVNVFGPPAGGKSLISMMAIAQVQKAGGQAVIWDSERSYSRNLSWMSVNGIDTSKLKFIKLRANQGAELGFDTIEKILAANAADLAGHHPADDGGGIAPQNRESTNLRTLEGAAVVVERKAQFPSSFVYRS